MGFRVIKTAIATMLAIVVADVVGVGGAISAGLLAILGVDVTRKRSIKSVSSRLFASVLGLILAYGLFYLLGFELWVLGLYILIAFPIISHAHFQEGIVTSSVVVFRVFGGAELSLDIFLTQVELLLIGLGSAMVVNMVYMPNVGDKLIQIRKDVDSLFSVIFRQIAQSLRNPEYIWDGKELIEARSTIDQGITLAERALDNQLMYTNEGWAIYLYMRKQQLDRIERMILLLSQVYRVMPQGESAAELFDQLSEDVMNEEYTGRTENLLFELEQTFKTMDLPTTRIEFEHRSAILQLCRELALFLDKSKNDKARSPRKVGH